MRESVHRVVTPCKVVARERVDHPVEQVEQSEGGREHDSRSSVDVGHAVNVASAAWINKEIVYFSSCGIENSPRA